MENNRLHLITLLRLMELVKNSLLQQIITLQMNRDLRFAITQTPSESCLFDFLTQGMYRVIILEVKLLSEFSFYDNVKEIFEEVLLEFLGIS